MVAITRRWSQVVFLAVALGFLLTTGLLYHRERDYVPSFNAGSWTKTTTTTTTTKVADSAPVTVDPVEYEKLHLLLPATNEEVNLCKTLLTAAMLDYPTPTLIGWNQTYDNTGGLLGWGSHVGKITGVREYLENLDSSRDNEIVLMMDAYDIWFQLRPEVLISRYHALNKIANERLRQRLGNAVDAANLQQSIIFGAGKRCAPNQVHTIACYPMPASPLPDDLYGPNTETIMGRNKYTSLKQRFLNSGYAIGPVKDMRQLWRRAQEKVDASASDQNPEWDNGSHGADFMYHGSDQSVFNIILGEQEFQREMARRKHRNAADIAAGIAKDPPPTRLEGTLIDDPLNPSFTHEPFTPVEGTNYEFGIHLDYFSELGQQTVNAEEDSRYIQFDADLDEQIHREPTGHFDCPRHVSADLPSDITTSRPPFKDFTSIDTVPQSATWRSVPLFTNMCLDTIPVMIHHNGNKDARFFSWPWTWMQPHARSIMGHLLSLQDPALQGPRAGGAWDREGFRRWGELCPSTTMDGELFRDIGQR